MFLRSKLAKQLQSASTTLMRHKRFIENTAFISAVTFSAYWWYEGLDQMAKDHAAFFKSGLAPEEKAAIERRQKEWCKRALSWEWR